MPRKSKIEKLQDAIGGEIDRFEGEDCSWLKLEDSRYAFEFSFDGKGNVFKELSVAKKIWEVVDEKIIIEHTPKSITQ